MLFDSLKINHVRNITNVHIEPGALLNVIIGPNASGKTALLEAIHLLSRARSFRTPRIKEVIQYRQPSLRVSARISNTKEKRIATGIEKSHGSTIIKHNGEALKTVSEQAGNIPLVIITPDSQHLVTGPPKQRRHWLDWAMFHVEPTYIKVWRNYQKALRNRNMLLKRGAGNSQISSWERGMVETAGVLNELRSRFVEKLRERLVLILSDVFVYPPDISFNKGCPEGLLFVDYLGKDREKDRQLGYTRYGPHKADLHFLIEGELLAGRYSRGQIKRFIAALLLAQAETYELLNGEKPVFLIDDYAAELDVRARSEMLVSLMDYGGQIFLTSTEEENSLPNLGEACLFHVEHGNIDKVVK